MRTQLHPQLWRQLFRCFIRHWPQNLPPPLPPAAPAGTAATAACLTCQPRSSGPVKGDLLRQVRTRVPHHTYLQIKERLDIDAHSLPYPEAPSIDASSLTHTPFVTPPHGAAANGSSLAACSPPDQPLPALSGLASPPPVPDKQPEPDGRSHSGALGSPPAAAVQVPPLPLRHASSVEEPLLEEPKVEGASWLHTGAPGVTLLEEAEPPGSLANDITVGVINVIIVRPHCYHCAHTSDTQ